jgi:hypothetical protein
VVRFANKKKTKKKPERNKTKQNKKNEHFQRFLIVEFDNDIFLIDKSSNLSIPLVSISSGSHDFQVPPVHSTLPSCSVTKENVRHWEGNAEKGWLFVPSSRLKGVELSTDHQAIMWYAYVLRMPFTFTQLIWQNNVSFQVPPDFRFGCFNNRITRH